MRSSDHSGGSRPNPNLGRVCDIAETVLGSIAGIALVAFVVVILVDVIYREVLESPLFAPSEVSVCLFIWSTLLAAAVAGRRNAHFVMDFLPKSMPARLDLGLRVLAALLAIVFALVLTWYGYGLAERGSRRVSPMTGLSMLWFYTAFPVAGLAFLLFTVEQLLLILLGADRSAAR